MAKGSCCLTSKKTNSVAAWWPVHWQAAVLFVVLISFSIIQSACDSKAKVQWENLDRSAMQKKLGSTTENAAVGNAYRDLTANLMENERELLNVLVGTVADRNPSKADKGATLIAIFSAVESVRSNSQTRASLPDVLIGLTTIAKPMDLALRRIADGLEGAKSDEKIFYLNNSINLVKALEKNPELFKFVEEITPRVSKENQTLISVLWAALPSDPLAQNKLVTNSYKAASVIGNDDFVRLFRSLQLDNLREFYLDALSNVFVSDSNAPLFVKVLTRIESDSLPNYSTILKEFFKSGVSPAIKNSIVDLLSKSVSLKQELLSSFIALAKDILAQPDASIRLNGMITSVDVLKGEGFYGQLLLTNKFATNKQPLVCQLQGKGTAKVQYSFHWIRNTNPTSPSQADVDDIPWTGLSSSQLSSSLIYDLDQAAQCFARVFVEGAKVIELAGERVTVKSAPPAFASGDKPSVAEVTVVQNKELIYDASGDPASDPNAGDVVVYRINKQPSHGVLVAQSDFLHFNYTPNPSYVGSDEFSYLACDQNGLCSEEKKVSITVQPANHVPVIHGVYGNGVINNTIVLAEDSTLQNVHLLLEDNDSGLEGLACNLPVTVTSTNTGVLADSGITLSGNFPYCSLEITPLQDKNTSFYGAASLRIGIYDVDNAKVFKDIPLVINPSEDPPTLSGYGTTVTTNEDVPFDITFTINDPDGALPCAASRLSYVSSDLNIVASSAVSWSEVSAPNSTSKICKGTFAVLADKNGVVNITLKVTDATNRSAVSSPPIVVTVNSVDDMPVVTNNGTTALAMTQDTSKSITLATATDADGAGHTPQAELITPPAHGSLLCGGSACIANSVLPSPVTYTANAAYTGTDQFTYKMCDPGALMTATTRCSSLISVTITVLGQTPVTTTLGDRTLVLAEDSLPFDIKLDAAVDPDGVLNSQTISYVIQNDTTAGLGTLAAPSLVPTTGFGTVHFTPSANKNGTASFEYKICDSATPVANCAGPFLVQLTLSDVNDVPVKDATVPYSTNLTMTKKYDDESGSTIVSPANIVLPLYSDVDVATNLQHVRPKLVIPPVQGTLSAGLSDSNVVNRVNAADPLQANRTVTYTPNFGYSGKDSLSYQICDYSAANVELSCGELVTVSLTITAVPLEYLPSGWTAPAARTLSLAVLEDVPKSFSFASVRASTVEASQHLSYKIISPALAGDSYVLGKDSGVGNLGRISATLPDVNPGKLAPFVFIPETSEDATGSFQYTICWDAGQTQCLQPVTVNVSVSAQDDAPLVATQGDVSVSVSQDSSKSVVLATGTDVDGAGHTPVAELFVLPTHGSLACGGPSSCVVSSVLTSPVTYTPTAGYSGSDSFQYKLCDPLGAEPTRCTAAITVSLSVLNKTPALNSSGDTTLTLAEDSVAAVVKLDGATDADAQLFSPAQTLAYQVQVAPTKGTLGTPSSVPGAGTGSVTYTPAADATGSDSFAYRVCDNATPANCSANVTVTVSITAVNDAPTMSSIADQVINQNASTGALSFTIADVDDPVSCTGGTHHVDVASNNTNLIPTGNVVIGVTASSCTVTVTPVADKNGGPVQISLSLSDGALTTTRVFNVTVKPTNTTPSVDTSGSSPAASSSSSSVTLPQGTFSYTHAHASLTLNEDDSATNITLVKGIDPDTSTAENVAPQKLSYVLVAAPSLGVLSTGNTAGFMNLATNVDPLSGATITYKPNLNQNGSDGFVYKICDSNLPTFACTGNIYVPIAITAVDDVPLLASNGTSAADLSQDSSKSVVLATGTDVDGAGHTPVAELFVLPTHGSLACGGPSSCVVSSVLTSPVTYTPTAGYSGSDSFQYKLCDPLGAEPTRCTAAITVSLSVLNKTPALNSSGDTTLTLAEDSVAAVVKLDGATDADAQLFSPAQTLAYQVQVAPTKGTLGTPSSVPGAGTGSVTYTPAADATGSDSFAYRVCDNATPANCSANVTVTVSITAVNDAPTMSSIADQVINQNASTGALSFTIADVDDPVSCTGGTHHVDVASNNTNLIPTGNVVIGVTASSCTVTVTPVADKNGGPVQISLSLSDGALTTTRVFNVTVKPTNTTPSVDTSGSSPAASSSSSSVTLPQGTFSYTHAHASLTLNEDDSATNITLVKGIDPDTSTAENVAPQKLSYVLVAAPSLGVLSTGNTAGFMNLATNVDPLSGATITYKPNLNQNGSDGFVYKICDSNLPTFACTGNIYVPIAITAVDDVPLLIVDGATSAATSNGGTTTISLGKFVDPDHPAATSLVYKFTLGGARVGAAIDGTISSPKPTDNTRNVTYTPLNDLAGNDVLKYKACTTTVSPERCSAELTIGVVLNSTVTGPGALTGGDSLVSVVESSSSGTVQISLPTSHDANSIQRKLIYVLLKDPSPQGTSITKSGGAAGAISFINPSNASSSMSTLNPENTGNKIVYNLANDVRTNTTDSVIFMVCQSESPYLCTSTRTVTINITATDDPATLTINNTTLDNGSSSRRSGAATVAMAVDFTISDPDTTVTCNDVSTSSSNTSLFPTGTVTGGATTNCTVTVTSADDSGDSVITLTKGAVSANFTATALSLDGSGKAKHLCAGSSITVGQAGATTTYQGIASCKVLVASGWDATRSLTASKDEFYESIDSTKLPDPRRYCTGIKLFGYLGMAYCGSGKDPLALHRDTNTNQLNTSTAPSADYRLFPDPSKDHNGGTTLTRPTTECGKTQASVAARIADCASKNGASSYWDGATQGNAGQGLWRLVTLNLVSGASCTGGTCSEVWRDERTGLLWSDRIVNNGATNTFNWCKASGNSNAVNNPPSAEADPQGICDDSGNQGQGQAAPDENPTSLCADHTAFLSKDAREALSRGNLDLGSTPKIRWWLPTRSDYMRAERHGLRFVLPNISNQFWTATVSSAVGGKAWIFDGSNGGGFSTSPRSTSKSVRCVGSP